MTLFTYLNFSSVISPGTILGLTHAGTSLLGTLAPIIGAVLLTNLGFPSLGITGAVINIVLLLVLTKY